MLSRSSKVSLTVDTTGGQGSSQKWPNFLGNDDCRRNSVRLSLNGPKFLEVQIKPNILIKYTNTNHNNNHHQQQQQQQQQPKLSHRSSRPLLKKVASERWGPNARVWIPYLGVSKNSGIPKLMVYEL